MAAVNSPFQSGGSVVELPYVDRGQKVIIRIENDADPLTYQVNIKVDGNPSGTAAGGYLNAGDAIEVKGPGRVSVISITGDPEIYHMIRPA